MINKIILLVFFMANINFSFSQIKYYELRWKADSCYKVKNYEGAVSNYKDAFSIKTGSINDYYDAACSASLSGDTSLAFKYIETIIEMGFESLERLKNDNDFNSLRGLNTWNKLLDFAKEKEIVRESKYNQQLKKELLLIYENDQKYRLKLNEHYKKSGYGVTDKNTKLIEDSMVIADSLNLKKVEQIIKNYGWLGTKEVGKNASNAIFFVIQHSSPNVIEKYLPLLRECVKKDNALPEFLALMEDRLAMYHGLKQIYGTQVRCDTTGKCWVYQIEDEKNVNRRREEIGLEPLQYYLRIYNIKWSNTDLIDNK